MKSLALALGLAPSPNLSFAVPTCQASGRQFGVRLGWVGFGVVWLYGFFSFGFGLVGGLFLGGAKGLGWVGRSLTSCWLGGLVFTSSFGRGYVPVQFLGLVAACACKLQESLVVPCTVQ